MAERYNHLQVSNTNNTNNTRKKCKASLSFTCVQRQGSQNTRKRSQKEMADISTLSYLANQYYCSQAIFVMIVCWRMSMHFMSFHHCLSPAFPSQQVVRIAPADTRGVVVLRAGAKPWPTSPWDIRIRHVSVWLRMSERLVNWMHLWAGIPKECIHSRSLEVSAQYPSRYWHKTKVVK